MADHSLSEGKIILRPRLSGSNHKTAAAWNRGLVLQLLRQHGPLSRRQLAEMVGLQISTLTYIIRELMERDVVRSMGKMKSKSVGQKRVMLSINPDIGWVVGVGLQKTEASLVLVDAAGKLLGEHSLSITPDLATIPEQLHAGINGLLDDIGHPPGKMLGLGVGVPGVVDTTAGMVLRSTLFNATRVPLRKTLADRFGVNIVIDHDACFGALAEAAEGASVGESHFVYLVINHTLRDEAAMIDAYGSAFYLNGTIYRGAHFAAGELTASLAPPESTLSLEELGILETPQAELSERLSKLAEAIANPFATIVNLIDVRRIVLAGTVGIVNKAFLLRIRDVVQRQVIELPDRETKVVASQMRGVAVARGAALAASDENFSNGRLLGLFPAASKVEMI